MPLSFEVWHRYTWCDECTMLVLPPILPVKCHGVFFLKFFWNEWHAVKHMAKLWLSTKDVLPEF
jgi:hypothetical protein